MKKHIAIFLFFLTATVFASHNWIYLNLNNDSSFNTKVVEGAMFKTNWMLSPGESTYSTYYFSTINHLQFYYKSADSSTWQAMTGCQPAMYYDHTVQVTFKDHTDPSTQHKKPVCRILVS